MNVKEDIFHATTFITRHNWDQDTFEYVCCYMRVPTFIDDNNAKILVIKSITTNENVETNNEYDISTDGDMICIKPKNTLGIYIEESPNFDSTTWITNPFKCIDCELENGAVKTLAEIWADANYIHPMKCPCLVFD